MAWFHSLSQGNEEHGYNDPDVPETKLRAWFHEIREEFPPMNGPLATEDFDNPKTTDYSLGRTAIYANFAWSVAREARQRTFDLAHKHGLGFFDVSTEGGGVWLPSEDGGYECVHGQGFEV